MPAGRLSCSRALRGAGIAAMLSVAGCSGSALLQSQPELRLQTVDATPLMVAPDVPQLRTQPIDDKVVIKPASTIPPPPESAVSTLPEWCRYLKEDSAAQATILRSPKLNGSVNDSGKASLSLSLSAGSFNKARLIEEASDIRCRKYLAESGLQKLVFLAPQGLTAAGYRAKANKISQRKRELADLRSLVRKELANGNLTVEKATGLTVMIDQIIADGDAARSNADRRLTNAISDPQEARKLAADLLRAEQDLETMNSRMRTADAFDVSVSAGWNDGDINNGFSTTNDSFSGKVSFSVNLGSFSPSRYEHERRATQAKLKALQSDEGGLLWQVDILRKAHLNALDGLTASRRKLDQALAEATKLVAVMRSVQSPEYASVLIAAKVQLVKLQAERAGVDGSISEIRANMKKLNLG